MNAVISDTISMAERLWEFDPSGQLPVMAVRIKDALGDRVNELGDAAFDGYMANATGTSHSPMELETLRQNAQAFHRELLGDLAGERWGEISRAFLHGAMASGLSIRTQIFTINKVVDKAREIITDAVADARSCRSSCAALPMPTRSARKTGSSAIANAKNFPTC
jgi:hypothetical protein